MGNDAFKPILEFKDIKYIFLKSPVMPPCKVVTSLMAQTIKTFIIAAYPDTQFSSLGFWFSLVFLLRNTLSVICPESLSYLF